MVPGVRRRIIVPNFIKIRQSIAEILGFFNFSTWRQAVRHFGLVWGIWSICGPPMETTLWSLSLCQIWL